MVIIIRANNCCKCPKCGTLTPTYALFKHKLLLYYKY